MNATMDRETAALRFDAGIRARHAAALTQLSPRLQAQLAQRTHAALRGQVRAARRTGLRHAALGLAALSALAVGLQFLHPLPERGPAPVVAAAGSVPAARPATLLLDEDPEFYAWLASTDADLVVKE